MVIMAAVATRKQARSTHSGWKRACLYDHPFLHYDQTNTSFFVPFIHLAVLCNHLYRDETSFFLFYQLPRLPTMLLPTRLLLPLPTPPPASASQSASSAATATPSTAHSPAPVPVPPKHDLSQGILVRPSASVFTGGRILVGLLLLAWILLFVKVVLLPPIGERRKARKPGFVIICDN